MQASPLVGAPWRSTSSMARSSSGPYSVPYLICRSNLIFGVLIRAWRVAVSQDQGKSFVQSAHGSLELGAGLAVVERNIAGPRRTAGRAAGGWATTRSGGNPNRAAIVWRHLKAAQPVVAGEVKDAVVLARGQLQQCPPHRDHIHRRADFLCRQRSPAARP